MEIVTLVVPGFSDDPDELKRMADFLASVDPLMPWHMTAFHPDYKMTEGYRHTTADGSDEDRRDRPTAPGFDISIPAICRARWVNGKTPAAITAIRR